ncbi:MAG TPA: hypothetical protein VGD74_08055, partial [Vulgatibacter sp.]
DAAALAIPGLDWENCGIGCERADTRQGGSSIAQRPRLSTTIRNGVETTYLVQWQPFYYKPERKRSVRNLSRIIDLTSGRTVAALQRVREPIQQSCNMREWSRENALHLELATGRLYAKGTFDLSTKRWIWQKPIREGVGVETCFPLEFQNGGRTLYLCKTRIYASLEPGSSEVTLFEDLEDEYVAESGSDDADLAIWTEMKRYQRGSRVRGWAPDGAGSRTILDDLPGDTCSVGLSATRFAGAMIEATGRRGCDARFGKFSVWYADRNGTAAGSTVSFSPQITDRAIVLDKTTTAGEYIAVQVIQQEGKHEDRDNVIFVRTSDWATRWLPPLPGHAVYDHALSTRYLYVALTGWGADYGDHEAVYRYDLSKFDSIGEPLE